MSNAKPGMDSKAREITQLGLVELDEDQLDAATGGAMSPGVTPKWDAPDVKIDLTDHKF